MIKIILITLLAHLYSMLEGYREALYDHNCQDQRELHPFYVIQRLAVVIAATISFEWDICFLLTTGLIFTFSFYHNGVYYRERENMRPGYAPLRWRDHRDGSAVFDLSYPLRAIMLIIGYMFITAAIYINNKI